MLNGHTMRDAIDPLIKRGHVIKFVSEGDEVLPPPHERHRMLEGQVRGFYKWSLYTAHHLFQDGSVI